MPDECYPCAMNARIGALPPRECVAVEGGWRVAHAFNSSLAGWLVVVPTRHVMALDSLTPDEVAPLGDLLRRLSAALRAVTGCTKTYLMMFAEQEGFGHLHIHVVPRLSSFTPDERGPRVFAYLSRPEAQWLSKEDQDGVSIAVREALAVVD